jgi:hypothetical protein
MGSRLRVLHRGASISAIRRYVHMSITMIECGQLLFSAWIRGETARYCPSILVSTLYSSMEKGFSFCVTDFEYSLIFATDYIFWIFWILVMDIQQGDLPPGGPTLCFCHGHYFLGIHTLLFLLSFMGPSSICIPLVLCFVGGVCN